MTFGTGSGAEMIFTVSPKATKTYDRRGDRIKIDLMEP